MTSQQSLPVTLWSRFHGWLPAVIDRRIRVAAWLSLATQIVIVGTGGAVRLTDSGLGCPTWPNCTAASLVATPEMGIHGVIEFGNRLLTFVLTAVAVAMFLLVLRLRAERPDLFRLSLLLALGVPAQALLGGVTVLTNLNPWVVGLHFVLSAVLVSLATVLVYRVYRGPRGVALGVPGWFGGIAHVLSAAVAITVLAGIVTTGSGPHSGDHGAARNGLDPEFLQHVHSWPAYATLVLTIVLLLGALRPAFAAVRPFVIGLLAVEGVQIAVGLAQSRLGLPEGLVALHMVLAVTLVAATTAVILSLRR